MTIRPKYETPKPSKADEADAYELVTLRDAGVCVKCRRVHPVFGVNRDHRKDRSVGGLTVASNLQLLCGSGTTGCHGWKSANPKEAAAEGWAVPGWPSADPKKWPARRWIRTDFGTLRLAWVLYDDDGGWIEITKSQAATAMTEMGWVK
jgi:hypothetical protein